MKKELTKQATWMLKQTAVLCVEFEGILVRGIKIGADVDDVKKVAMAFACAILDTTSETYRFNTSEVAQKVAEMLYNYTEGGDI